MAHAIAAQNQSIQPPTHAPASRGSSCLHEKRAQTGAVLFRMCLANPDPGKGRRVRQRLLGFCADRIYLDSLYLECSASLHLLQSMHELDVSYALKLYTWTSDAFINVETLLCFPTIHRWISLTTPWTQPRRYRSPSLIAEELRLGRHANSKRPPKLRSACNECHAAKVCCSHYIYPAGVSDIVSGSLLWREDRLSTLLKPPSQMCLFHLANR